MSREAVAFRPPAGSGEAAAGEAEHVHAVYEEIAEHFSDTRYRAWPVVERFLAGLPRYSVLADLGCGNGKNLDVRGPGELHALGVDRSRGLCEIARRRTGREVCQMDVRALTLRSGSCDAAICVAVIHHLMTHERRAAAVRECLRVVRPGGTVLLYVWAFEQPENRRKFGEAREQDLLVPWSVRGSTRTCQRYYHLFRQHELEELAAASGAAEVVESGYDRDNWFVILRKSTLDCGCIE